MATIYKIVHVDIHWVSYLLECYLSKINILKYENFEENAKIFEKLEISSHLKYLAQPVNISIYENSTYITHNTIESNSIISHLKDDIVDINIPQALVIIGLYNFAKKHHIIYNEILKCELNLIFYKSSKNMQNLNFLEQIYFLNFFTKKNKIDFNLLENIQKVGYLDELRSKTSKKDIESLFFYRIKNEDSREKDQMIKETDSFECHLCGKAHIIEELNFTFKDDHQYYKCENKEEKINFSNKYQEVSDKSSDYCNTFNCPICDKEFLYTFDDKDLNLYFVTYQSFGKIFEIRDDIITLKCDHSGTDFEGDTFSFKLTQALDANRTKKYLFLNLQTFILNKYKFIVELNKGNKIFTLKLFKIG